MTDHFRSVFGTQIQFQHHCNKALPQSTLISAFVHCNLHLSDKALSTQRQHNRSALKPIENMAVNTRKRPPKGRGTSKASKRKNPANRGKKRRQEEIEEEEAYDSDATRGIDESEEEIEEPEDDEVEEAGESNLNAKDTKIAELEAQLKVAQGTAKIVPYTLKGMKKAGASKTYAKLMKDHLVENWWGLQPFTCNEKSLDKISARLYRTMMSKEDKAIKEEVAKKQAQDTWIALHRDVIRQLFNEIRNYYQGQLRKEWMVHALAELMKIPQEEIRCFTRGRMQTAAL